MSWDLWCWQVILKPGKQHGRCFEVRRQEFMSNVLAAPRRVNTFVGERAGLEKTTSPGMEFARSQTIDVALSASS